MRIHIIMFKNVKINAYTTPNFIDIEPEVAAEQLKRSIIINADDDKLLAPYENLDMYWVGDFDDIEGIFYTNSEAQFLLSPRELILQLRAEKLAKAKADAKESEIVNS